MDEFIAFLGRYRDELKTALSNESEKRRALMSGDPKKLESMLQLQQAETMKLQNMESRRLEKQKQLGYAGLTAQQLIATVSDGKQKEKLAAVLDEITQLALALKEQNSRSIELANTSLKMMEQVAVSAGIDAQHGLYSPETAKGGTYSKDPSFEKMV